ncbi:MAG: hypothetical protein IIY87_04740, partial [Bacteroidales bacterium]|nr:hypothetical protein [Bacteroidales bacterium]
TPYTTMKMLSSAGSDIRLRLGKKHYITASAQVLHEADSFGDYFDKELSQWHIGFALEYAYSSLLGPFRFNVHWSDLTRSFGVYCGIGLDF